MTGISITPPVDLTAALAAKADKAAIPAPAIAAPMAEKTGAAVGQQTGRFALEDHQHPRLTSTTHATLAADGTSTVTFTRSFTNAPGVVITEVGAANSQPLVCVVQSWMRETMAPSPSGAYVGCVVKGYRSQALPTQPAQLNILALLGTVIGGVNTLLSSLTGFNVFGGSSAGATVSVIAVARSDVAAA